MHIQHNTTIPWQSIRLIFFDMAGTTVDDNINGVPMVIAGFQKTFKQLLNIDLSVQQVNPHRGKGKLDAIKSLLTETYNADNNAISLLRIAHQSSSPNALNKAIVELSQKLFKHFVTVLDHLTESANSEIAGTAQLFKYCRQHNIKIAVGSGFPHKTVTTLVKNIGWTDLDYVGSIDTVNGKGRPDPAMIHAAMQQCQITDAKQVVKVGDTVVDIKEARNAGCWAVGVLSGTQSRQELQKGKPDLIVEKAVDIIPYFEQATRRSKL